MNGPLLNEPGPGEIRATPAAVNQMQDRLMGFVAGCPRMLALLDEKQHMTAATLAVTRDDTAQEAARNTDLETLPASSVPDVRKRGAP